MSIKDEKEYTLVTTTGIHIARRIGDAMSRSYKGDYSFQYAEGDKSIRVYWHQRLLKVKYDHILKYKSIISGKSNLRKFVNPSLFHLILVSSSLSNRDKH